MKTKTTIKAIHNAYDKIFYCGYCELYDIMKYTEPQFYNAGVYGWNCDIYTDWRRGIAITTGYRNMVGTKIPDEIIKKYTEAAKKIVEDAKYSKYEEAKKALDENRDKFFEEIYNM